jgi:hypothetical protein
MYENGSYARRMTHTHTHARARAHTLINAYLVQETSDDTSVYDVSQGEDPPDAGEDDERDGDDEDLSEGAAVSDLERLVHTQAGVGTVHTPYTIYHVIYSTVSDLERLVHTQAGVGTVQTHTHTP